MPNRQATPVEQHEVLAKLKHDHAHYFENNLRPAIVNYHAAATTYEELGFVAEVYETIAAFPRRTRPELLTLVRKTNPHRARDELKAAMDALDSEGFLRTEGRFPKRYLAGYWPVAG